MDKKIVFKQTDIVFIKEHINKYLKDGLEDGVGLLGKIHENNVYEIKKVVTFEKADRSEVHFTTDPEAVNESIKANPDLHYFVDIHSHPHQNEPSPSCTDINQLREAKKERPYTIMGIYGRMGLKFFDFDQQGNLIVLEYREILDSFDEKNLLSRISELTENEKIKHQNVAVLGCGSLASPMIECVACTGIRKFLVGDMDSLTDVNLIRHLGRIQDIGKDKTEVFKEFIESKNPLANVTTVKDDLVKNRNLLKYIVNWADIIIASSGNPELNYQINRLCVELKKSAVFGGIYDRAESAYVSYYCPDENKACFDCIFGLTSAAVDNNTIARKYGLEDGELKEAQGMYKDIMIPGAMMASFAIDLMMGQKPECNLVRYYNNLKVERFIVPQKKECATCNYQNWLQKEQKELGPKQNSVWNFWKKFRRFLND